MDRSAEALAAEARRRAGFGWSPTNIVKLSTALGISSIEVRPTLGRCGQLEGHRGDSRIVIGGGLLEDGYLTGRQLFTVGHELAHHLLEQIEGVPRQDQLHNRDIESYCDEVASALLLPPVWLRENYRAVPPTLAALDRVCRRTGVTAAAATVALCRSAGWSAGLLQFVEREGRLRLRWSTVGGGLQRKLASLPATHQALRAACERGQRIELPMKLDGELVVMPAEVSAHRDPLVLIDVNGIRPGPQLGGSTGNRATTSTSPNEPLPLNLDEISSTVAQAQSLPGGGARQGRLW